MRDTTFGFVGISKVEPENELLWIIVKRK